MKVGRRLKVSAAVALAGVITLLPNSASATHTGTGTFGKFSNGRTSCFYNGNTLATIVVPPPSVMAAPGYTNQKVSWTFKIRAYNGTDGTFLTSTFAGESAYAPNDSTAAPLSQGARVTAPGGYDAYKVRTYIRWYDAAGTTVIGSAAGYGRHALRQGPFGGTTTSIDSSEPGCIAQNDAPVATSDTYSVAACDTLTVPSPGLLSNDSDGDPWQNMGIDVRARVVGQSFASADHAFGWSSKGYFTYRANCNNGGNVATFRYVLTDDFGLQSEATVTINVTGGAAPAPGNQAPTASNASWTLNGGYTHKRWLTASDPEGGALDWQLLGQSFATATHKFIWHDDGSFSITPPAGTKPTFTFRVCDAQGACSNTATVSITAA